MKIKANLTKEIEAKRLHARASELRSVKKLIIEEREAGREIEPAMVYYYFKKFGLKTNFCAGNSGKKKQS